MESGNELYQLDVTNVGDDQSTSGMNASGGPGINQAEYAFTQITHAINGVSWACSTLTSNPMQREYANKPTRTIEQLQSIKRQLMEVKSEIDLVIKDYRKRHSNDAK
jgi:hypothetical protein